MLEGARIQSEFTGIEPHLKVGQTVGASHDVRFWGKNVGEATNPPP